MAIAQIPLLISIVLAAQSGPAGEHPSVVVVEEISLPSHLDAFHERARDVMMKVVERGGWDIVDGGSSSCKEAECAPDLARSTGAALVLVADGKYRMGGYDLRVQLWDGQEMAVDQGSCEDCTGPEFVSRLEGMVGPLVEAQNKKRASARARPPDPRAPTAPQPAPPASMAVEQTAPRGYVAPLGWALVAVGAIAAAGGGYLLWADGRLENCVGTSAGTQSCSRERVTRGGWPLVAGGASVAVLGGAMLLHHYLTAAAGLNVGVGPSSVALSGRF
jgi:hypothetical protein